MALEITPVLSLPAPGNKSFSTLLFLGHAYLTLHSPRCEPTAFSYSTSWISLFCHYTPSRPPAYGIVPPTFGVGLPSIVNILWNTFTDTPGGYLLGASQSN
jgi:hypothetical protein